VENAKVVLQALIEEAVEGGPVKMEHLADQLAVLAVELRDLAQIRRERMIAAQSAPDNSPRTWRDGRKS
jgi:hypothetical protein